MKVKNIQLKFESSETSLPIDKEHIESMCFDIDNAVWTMDEDKELDKKVIANNLYIILFNSANYQLSDGLSFFDRLKQFNDITDIIITYEDNTQDIVCPPYVGANNGNLCQEVITDDDKLVIKIG